MGKGEQTYYNDRVKIIIMREAKMGFSAISKQLGINRTTCITVFKHYAETGALDADGLKNSQTAFHAI